MVTTRAGSRAASEVSTPAKSPPPVTPRRARRSIKTETDADSTPSRTTTSTSTRPLRLGATARRRARQKDRIRALRSARGDGWPTLADVEPDLAAKLRSTLADLLAALDGTDTICPSRAPRAIAADDEKYPDWTRLVGPARAVARHMAEKGEARLVSDAEGPVRIGRVW